MGWKIFIDKTDPHTGVRTISLNIGNPVPRAGYEKVLLPGIKVELPSFHRVHVVGPGFGYEAKTIYYAPAKFNLSYQNCGVEAHIRELFKEKAPGVEIRVTVVAKPLASTLMLAEITYKVELVKASKISTFYEASLEIEEPRNHQSKINVSVYPGSAYYETDVYLKKPAAKQIPDKIARKRDAKTRSKTDNDKIKKNITKGASDTDLDRGTASKGIGADVPIRALGATEAKGVSNARTVIRRNKIQKIMNLAGKARDAIDKHFLLMADVTLKFMAVKSFIDGITGAIETISTAQNKALILAGVELRPEAKACENILNKAQIIYQESNEMLDNLLDPDFFEDFMSSLETTDRTELLFLDEPFIACKNYVKKILPKANKNIQLLDEKINLLNAVLSKLEKVMKDSRFLTATTAAVVLFEGDTSQFMLTLLEYHETMVLMRSFLRQALDSYRQTVVVLNSIEDHAIFMEDHLQKRVIYLSDHQLLTGPGISFTN